MGYRGKHKNKRDANEREIFDIIRHYGISVEPLDVPCDAVCGYNGVSYLVEVKNGLTATLTPAQKKFKADWKGNFEVLRTNDAAMLWAKKIRGLKNNNLVSIPFEGVIS